MFGSVGRWLRDRKTDGNAASGQVDARQVELDRFSDAAADALRGGNGAAVASAWAEAGRLAVTPDDKDGFAWVELLEVAWHAVRSGNVSREGEWRVVYRAPSIRGKNPVTMTISGRNNSEVATILESRPFWDGLTPLNGSTGRGFGTEVAGASFYQDDLMELRSSLETGEDWQVTLWPEPDNTHDQHAVAVQWFGATIGHLPQDEALRYQPLCLDLLTRGKRLVCRGKLTGGIGGKKIGVVLDLDSPTALRDALTSTGAGGS